MAKKTNKIKLAEIGEFSADKKDSRKLETYFVASDKVETKTELAGMRQTVFGDRYSLKNEKGDSMEEYPEQMWKRVSKAIADFETTKVKRESWEEKFYETIKDFKFIPAGRILSGAGTGYQVTFFNCYVIPSPKDSRHGIMESITNTVEIQARAGGVGLNLSSLRPRGARVKKVNGTSSGPVNWASLYSTANHDVIQQGGSRRGALMLMLHDWHPDIEEFIRVKEDLSKIPGANLSVCVSDSFMEAVKEDADWDLVFPDLDDPDYDEVWGGDIDDWRERGKKVITYNTVKARDVWDMISEAAWRSAEPGLHFLERSNKRSNTWYFEKQVATNPCGEQHLGEWAVCNLGAMNLSAFVKDGEFDFDSLADNVKVAMRFMDNVVDANYYFFKENWDSQKNIRRTGLGTMGLGDALIKMKIRYGNEESLQIIEKIYKTIRDNAYETSADLAKEKGAFPKFDKSNYMKGYFIKKLPKNIKDKIKKYGIRNAVILTQAPTGTTSLLAGVSSGIEPNYDFEFTRKDRTGEHTILHPLFEEWKKENPDKEKPDYFVTSNDLSPEDHVRVQAKVQEYTDSSISKTVNAPENYSVEDVNRLYKMAYELGCKGITFFRDGSRQGVLERKKETKEEKQVMDDTQEPMYERPIVVMGATYKLNTPQGKAFITINEDENGEPLEVFINIGKAGSDTTAMAAALGRTISTAFRFRGGVGAIEKAKEITDQLAGIGGRRSVGFGPTKILSLPDAVAAALSMHFNFNVNGFTQLGGYTNGHAVNGNGEAIVNGVQQNGVKLEQIAVSEVKEMSEGMQIAVEATSPVTQGDICPECGASSLVYQEGCAKCYTCGHSEC